MKLTNVTAIATMVVAIFTLSFLGCKKDLSDPSLTSDAKASALGAPTLTCNGSTEVSINLLVTAAQSGAPAGFSIQWMTAAAFGVGPDGIAGTADDNTWVSSEDPRLCKASFSGNANESRYRLTAGQSVNVNIGELLFDNGTSTNCGDALICGTSYVFRSFAHANNTVAKSNFSTNIFCSTLPCDDGGTLPGCTYTQGYWKTHGPLPTGNNVNEWAQSVKDNGMMLGSVNYTAGQLQSILNQPASGNGLITLAHQLIAAKLNVASGADGSAVASLILSADALIGDRIAPPVGSGSLTPGSTSALVTAFTNYNEGATGPGHCD